MNAYFTAAVAGLTAGGAYALLGVCAVFTYRLVAVVNFVGAAIGAAGAFAFAMLAEQGVPLWWSALGGVAVGAAMGAVVGAIMTHWFAEKSASTKAAVAVALLVGLTAIGLRITGGQHPHEFPVLIGGLDAVDRKSLDRRKLLGGSREGLDIPHDRCRPVLAGIVAHTHHEHAIARPGADSAAW